MGNPLTLATTCGATTTSEAFTYDPMNRLLQNYQGATTCDNTPTTDTTNAYDRVGNRTSEDRVGVTNPGTTTYTHDAADETTSSTKASTTTPPTVTTSTGS